MSVLFETDMDRLAELQAVGEAVAYTPLGGDAKTIYVIFDNVSLVSDTTGKVVGSRPEARGRTIDLTGTVVGGSLLIGGTTYTIKTNLPDDTGMTDMELSEA